MIPTYSFLGSPRSCSELLAWGEGCLGGFEGQLRRLGSVCGQLPLSPNVCSQVSQSLKSHH